MNQLFGEFNDHLPPSQEYLAIQFSPSSISLQERWQNNGLSADFMAYYLMSFFPRNEQSSEAISKQEEIKSAVSYIANELLENAMKFSDETSQYPITISLQLHPDRLVFITTNPVPPDIIDEFQSYLHELTTCDPDELYMHQLEKNAEDETLTSSRLGFLTMINDYLAKVGWKFETVQKEPDVITVTTMVQLLV